MLNITLIYNSDIDNRKCFLIFFEYFFIIYVKECKRSLYGCKNYSNIILHEYDYGYITTLLLPPVYYAL